MKLTPAFMLALLTLIGPRVGANPIACVEPDIANTLLGFPGQGQVAIERRIPDKFPSIELPADFNLIGSRVAQHFTMVAFKATGTTDQVRERTKSSLENISWQFPAVAFSGLAGGFQSSELQQYRSALNACHDEYGTMGIAFGQADDDKSYVIFTAATEQLIMGCHMQQSAARALRMPHFPTLELPASGIKNSRFGGSGSGGDGATTRIYLETELSATDLLAHYDAQLKAQHWQMDGAWQGAKSSGSAWVSADGKKTGLLTVLHQGDASYRLAFQIISQSHTSVLGGTIAIQ